MVISSTPASQAQKSEGGNVKDCEKVFDSFRKVVSRLISDKSEFEQTASIISDLAVLKSTDTFLSVALPSKRSVKSRIYSRVLLSAFMIVKHPEVLNCESHDIRKRSESLLSLLSDTLSNDKAEAIHKFADEFEEYLVAFDQWKREDAEALKSDLKREMESAESLRKAIQKESKQVQEDWIPELDSLKSQVNSMLDKLSHLNSKSIVEEKRMEQPSNVQIVHDLFVEGPAKFDYFSLYMPDHKAKLMKRVELLWDSPTNEVIVESIESVKKSLLGLVNEGGNTYKLINEGLDLELVRVSVSKGQYQDTIKFIVEMMAELCAPIRDDKIQELRNNSEIPSKVLASIVEMTSQLCSDKIMFDIAKVMPRLPELITQYERDAFVEEYSSLPLTEAACKKVYKYPGMQAEALAAELFSLSLSSEVCVEMMWLDRKRIAKYKAEIERISLIVTRRLTNKIVASDDPTLALLRKRTIEYIRESILPNNGLLSPRIDSTLSLEEMTLLRSLESEIVELFKFHFKVYQPVYAHLTKNFQQ